MSDSETRALINRLLDGIDREAGGAAVAERDHLPALVLADEAEARLPFSEAAVPGTEGAQEPPVGLRLGPTCGMALHPPQRDGGGPAESLLSRRGD